MKNKKWLKPLIVLVVIAVVIAIAASAIMNYLNSRSVALTFDDVITTVRALSSYLIPLAVILVLAVVISLVAFAIKRPLASLIRGEALVAAILAILIVFNMVCMGPEFTLLNNAFGDTYLLADSTIAASEQLVQDIADEGIVLLKNEGGALPLSNVSKLNVFGWSSTSPS